MKNEKPSIFEKLRGKGFLIALLLSLTAVGIATYVTYSNAVSKIENIDWMPEGTENSYTHTELNSNENLGIETDAEQQQAEAVGKNETNIPKENEAETQTDENSAQQEAEAANSFYRSKTPYVMPVEGEILNPFSNGELVKSKTLDLWKTHDGIDIAAQAGTEVVSMNSGTVTEISDDPLWGVTITIDHGSGIIGIYSNLSDNTQVSMGETVMSGQVIGYVGESADIEIMEESHLHFAVKKNDSWIDPLLLINTEQTETTAETSGAESSAAETSSSEIDVTIE